MTHRPSPATPRGATEPSLGEARRLVLSAEAIRDRLDREGVALSDAEAAALRAATGALWERADDLDALLAGMLSSRHRLDAGADGRTRKPAG